MPEKLFPRILWLVFLLGLNFAFSDYMECLNYGTLEEEKANEVFKDWPVNLDLATVNRTHKCYVACIFYYYGIVGSAGELRLDKYFDNGSINELAVAPNLRRCGHEFRNEKDFCEHVFGMFDCFRQGMVFG
uniref:Odorant-binding protein 57d1 n=1 Tax=Drosophila ficusphila TaxID=30025 RepID=B0M2E2_DROFC|nr:odorant-binding protein 57d1 [Drosophila ficusphila]